MFLFFKKLQLICLKKKQKKTIHSKHYLQFLSI